MVNEQSKAQYLVGSVWPTNRTGVLGDKELDPKLPPSIRLVHLSMEFTQGTQAEFRASMPGYEAKAAELAALGPDLIRVIGAPPFMLLGYEGERDTIRSWESRYGIPMVTSGQNHVRAFRTLGVRRLVGASYFPEELNALFRAYLTDAGFEVLGMEGIDVPFADVPKVPVFGDPAAAHGHVRQTPRRRMPLHAGLRMEDSGHHRPAGGRPRRTRGARAAGPLLGDADAARCAPADSGLRTAARRDARAGLKISNSSFPLSQAVSKPHPSEAMTPAIVIPAKAGIQAGWRGKTPRRGPLQDGGGAGFPLSRE